MAKYDIEAGKKRNYLNEDEINEYKEKAKSGDGECAYRLGIMCLDYYNTQQLRKTGYEWFDKASKLGHIDAIARLGDCYRRGLGVTAELEQGVKLIAQASRMGSGVGARLLGICYEYGYGVEKNIEKATELYILGAERGDHIGACNAGYMYDTGTGIKADKQKAKELYLKACEGYVARAFNNYALLHKQEDPKVYAEYMEYGAELGYVNSYSSIGLAYFSGTGVETNNDKAFTWLEKSANAGQTNSMNTVAYFWGAGIGCEKDAKKSYEWYKKSADKGDSYGMFGLAICYDEARGVSYSAKKALEWYKKSADAGEEDACTNYGLMNENGTGCKMAKKEAADYYKMAMDKGSKTSTRNLARLIKAGTGIEKNVDKAIEMFLETAESSNGMSYNDLGNLYKEEKDYIDYAKAKMYFEKAIEKGNVYGTHNIGELYLKGLGVEQDYKKAFDLFTKANKEKENHWSQYQLACLYDSGNGCTKDTKKALELYYESAKGCDDDAVPHVMKLESEKIVTGTKAELEKQLDNGEACFSLGMLYLEGNGVDKDHTKAKEYFDKAKELSCSRGVYGYALLELNAEGSINVPKVFDYLQKASLKGSREAMYDLGDLYAKGHKGISVDNKKALEFYEKSAGYGYIKGMLKTAEYYYNGFGTQIRQNTAFDWLEIGAKSGDKDAQREFGKMLYARDREPNAMEKGLEWLGKSAEQGDKDSKELLKNYKK